MVNHHKMKKNPIGYHREKAIMKKSIGKEVVAFVKDAVLWNLSGGLGYQLYLCILAAMIMIGIYAYFIQINLGLTSTNLSNIVSWGFYIANFTFLVGVAAAAVMLILPAYIFRDSDLHRVPWIWTSIALNLIGTLTLAFTPGHNNPRILFPACILLFLGIWIEKGMGLIVPGLVPSPLGEVVSYAPTWVEISITLGVLALGILIVTVLIKPALIIEQRFQTQQ
jgi:Ni/Fe-hydrogenase subunit HybB-like protein